MLEGHAGCVNTVAFDPDDGRLLVSGSDDLQIALWRWEERGPPAASWDSGHTNNVFQARFMPGSGKRALISCAADGQVRAAALPEGVGTGTGAGGVAGAAAGSGGRGAAAAANSAAPRVPSRRLAQHDGRAHRLALDAGAPRHCFFSCGEDGEVHHFDLRLARAQRRLLVAHGAGGGAVDLNCVHSNPWRPHLFAVGGGDEHVRVYDLRAAGGAGGGAGGAGGAGGGGGRADTGRGADAGAGGGFFAMRDAPLARLVPARLRPPRGAAAGVGARARRRAFGQKHVTGLQFSRRGELLATYNDDDIYLFSPEGYATAGDGGGAAVAAARMERRPAAAVAADEGGGGGGGAGAAAAAAAAGGRGALRRRRSGEFVAGREGNETAAVKETAHSAAGANLALPH